MAIRYKAGPYNAALAAAAAASCAFAILAAPAAVIGSGVQAIGLGFLDASSVPVRGGAAGGLAAIAFLLAWLALRCCDPLPSPAEQADPDQTNWPVTARFKAMRARAGESEPDPFAELARGAAPLEGPLELVAAHLVPAEAEATAVEEVTAQDVFAAVPIFRPQRQRVSDLVQHLNAGFVESEWPLPANQQGSPDAEQRLVSVLEDLKAVARNG